MIATRVCACAAVFLAAACTTAPLDSGIPARPGAPFDLSGRMSVAYEGRAFSSGLRWQHAAGRDEIWLLTPTGQALAHIVDDGEGAVFTGADQRQHRAADVESLTRRALGWELPVARLRYWVRGEAAPGSAPESVARAGDRIEQLAQGGWRVTLEYYPANEFDGLPRRLELARDGHLIRLVIDNWRSGRAP